MKGPPQELRNFAVAVASEVPVEIGRYNRQREIVVYANLAPGKVLGEAQGEIDGFMKGAAPAGYATEWTGQAQIMTESFGYLLETMVLSVIVIYMVLAAQFESLVHPFTIMLSLPLAIPFAMLSLLLTGQDFTIFSILGVFMLFGIVKKNAILQVDYTNTLRGRGLPRDEAILQANKTRLRPILMTTLVLVAAMTPVALGRGPGSASRATMAVVIIGGQTMCLLITLLLTPVAYSIFDDASQWFRRRWVRRDGIPS